MASPDYADKLAGMACEVQMVTDWEATGTMLQGIGAIITPIGVVFAAFIAANTFDNWKKQKVTERKIEHAENTLSATYRVRDSLRFIRSRGLYQDEFLRADVELQEKAVAKKDGPDADNQRLAMVLVQRIRETEASWDALAEVLPFAKAFFSSDLEQALESLHQQRWLLRTYIDEYEETEHQTDRWVELRRIMFANLDEDLDPISEAARNAIERIEAECLRVLRSR
ncbi:MAG: hypothetical protein AAGB23_07605 [Pseudomonadota bacterium]